jgi:uncharacterized protein
VPTFEAKERGFTGWISATRDTIAFIESLKPVQFEGSEDKTVSWQTRSSTKSMQGTPYLFHHLLPNVFFHVTTAYDILRQSGLSQAAGRSRKSDARCHPTGTMDSIAHISSAKP